MVNSQSKYTYVLVSYKRWIIHLNLRLPWLGPPPKVGIANPPKYAEESDLNWSRGLDASTGPIVQNLARAGVLYGKRYR